jgi:hypothetical protein
VKTKPAGSTSVKTVLAAADGPLFFTWYEYVKGVLAKGAPVLAGSFS